MELHRGRVSVYSEGEGHGCTFTVELPLVTLTDDQQLQPQSPGLVHLSSHEPSQSRPVAADVLTRSPSRMPAGYSRQSSSLRMAKLSVKTKQKSVSGKLLIPRSTSDLSLHRRRMLKLKSAQVVVADEGKSSEFVLSALVVDDSLMTRKMLCRYLKGKCYPLLEADNGAMAVAIMKETLLHSPRLNVVLMDHNMPEMDGPTAARAMRAMGFRGLIIGVTGNAIPAEREAYLNAGANHVFLKPLDVGDLDVVLKGTSGRFQSLFYISYTDTYNC